MRSGPLPRYPPLPGMRTGGAERNGTRPTGKQRQTEPPASASSPTSKRQLAQPLPSAPAEQRANPRPRRPSSFLSRGGEKRQREATARRGVTPRPRCTSPSRAEKGGGAEADFHP